MPHTLAILIPLLQMLGSAAGSGAVVYYMLEQYDQLRPQHKLSPAAKRYAALALATVLGIAAHAALAAATGTPIGDAIDQAAAAALAFVASQLRHAPKLKHAIELAWANGSRIESEPTETPARITDAQLAQLAAETPRERYERQLADLRHDYTTQAAQLSADYAQQLATETPLEGYQRRTAELASALGVERHAAPLSRPDVSLADVQLDHLSAAELRRMASPIRERGEG